jgi:transcriptional regulator GlxA family with amidase domain
VTGSLFVERPGWRPLPRPRSIALGVGEQGSVPSTGAPCDEDITVRKHGCRMAEACVRQPAGTGPAVAPGEAHSGAYKRPLEPYFLKRADRFVQEHIGEAFTVGQVAAHCDVSWRTLEKAFTDFRGVTPVAHVRNVRLDRAQQALDDGKLSVAEIAARCGFRSSTTFALEYRKRFGVPPSHARHVTKS